MINFRVFVIERTMATRRTAAIFFFLTAFSFGAGAQEARSGEMAVAEDSLHRAFESLYALGGDEERKAKSVEIARYFGEVLHDPGSYDYPFDSLTRIGKVFSPDRRLRAITWNVPLSDGTHAYYGFIQYLRRKWGKKMVLYPLEELSSYPEHTETAVFDTRHWPGALYYEIRVNKHAGKAYYTLFGFDFNDMYSNKKVLDAVTIDRDGSLRFGAPIFVTADGKVQTRVIFEYSANAVMTLRYDPSLKMIVFDHLSPIEAGLEGVYKFYGPDFSYDGFVFTDGKWHYRSDLDVRNR